MQLDKKSVPVSFEFYPAKTTKSEQSLDITTKELSIHNPEFYSITYGAGGSMRGRTLETVLQVNKQTSIQTIPHISCIADNKKDLATLIEKYISYGINNLVVLRGDLPSGIGSGGEIRHANELINFIREKTGDHFSLYVAAYPETHPQSESFEKDLLNFKRKVDAGATAAITQYFFNIDSFLYFRDRAIKLGINIPIIAGIMPIINFFNLMRFSDICGAEIPRWIRKQCEAYRDDTVSIKKFGEEVVTRLCEQLIQNDVASLHFYTLNQLLPTQTICNNLNL